MSVDYRDIPALNQSSLKKILTHPQDYLSAVKRTGESKEDHFVFGSMVDIMLTGTREEFDSKFYVDKSNINVSDAVKVITNDIVEELKDLGVSLENWEQERAVILKHVVRNNYQGNWKDDTRIDAIIKAANAYVQMLSEVNGRAIVDELSYSKAINCVASLRSDQFTAPFSISAKKAPKGVEVFDKFIVSYEHMGVNMKGELDRVMIDHVAQTIKPIDFKTTSKPLMSFMGEFWKLRYDFQAATYSLGLFKHPEINELIEKGYTIDPFRFIVTHVDSITSPMVFTVPPKAVQIGLLGGETSVRYYEGLEQAIQRYQYAMANNAWDYPQEYYQKGSIDVEI